MLQPIAERLDGFPRIQALEILRVHVEHRHWVFPPGWTIVRQSTDTLVEKACPLTHLLQYILREYPVVFTAAGAACWLGPHATGVDPWSPGRAAATLFDPSFVDALNDRLRGGDPAQALAFIDTERLIYQVEWLQEQAEATPGA